MFKNNKKFPILSKKLNGFITAESRNISKKGILTFAIGTMLLGAGISEINATHDNSCTTDLMASPSSAGLDCGSTLTGAICEHFYCGNKGNLSAGVNTTVQGHYSSSSLIGRPSIGHSSHGSHGSYVY